MRVRVSKEKQDVACPWKEGVGEGRGDMMCLQLLSMRNHNKESLQYPEASSSCLKKTSLFIPLIFPRVTSMLILLSAMSDG